MEKNLLIVGSVTYAMKARDILHTNGFSAYMERTKRTKEFGCGYGLYVPKRADEAERLLVGRGIKILARVSREAS